VENTLGGFGGKTDIFRIMPGICNRGCRDRGSCNVYIIRGRFRPWRRVHAPLSRRPRMCACDVREGHMVSHSHAYARMHACLRMCTSTSKRRVARIHSDRSRYVAPVGTIIQQKNRGTFVRPPLIPELPRHFWRICIKP